MKQIIEKLASLERDIASKKVSSLSLRCFFEKIQMVSGISWHQHRGSKRTIGKVWNISSTNCVRGSIHKNCCLSR
jgi:hypothetical protein